ncbi:hypothetical protein KK062_19415 [Fulvivirgaceae bacterium PWU5]|uniref:Uncharacterized protein n=1 Tax=Dawidia cretensis TaxID=2782350 RepID=A0AAP2E2J8_9BACT|nr:hypothetical protein [Dawidia cretensis]MBT1710422.1 hypothetical protein [Dawidia cretensis]
MNFRDYLTSKKIDTEAFRQAEPALWATWSAEFAEMHPSSFTAQKLYLINPVRRKYTLQIEVVSEKTATTLSQPVTTTATETIAPKPAVARPAIAKPMMKPKPAETGEQPAASKPVIPRPVMKPKPPMEQLTQADATAAEKNTTNDIIPAQATETPAPTAKPAVKPVIPRPVIKPAIPASAPESTAATAGIPSQDVTSSSDTQPTPEAAPPATPETPPAAKPAKPGMARPVIKPPKPKTD